MLRYSAIHDGYSKQLMGENADHLVEHPLFWGLRWLGRYQRPLTTLVVAYLRFRPSNFFYVSQGPFEASLRIALLLFGIAMSASVIIGAVLLFSLGQSVYQSAWNMIRTGLFFLPLVVLPLYIVLRFVGRVKAGFFITNVLSIANLAWWLVFFVFSLFGVVLSGSLARDLSDIHRGQGRASPLYEVVCKPLDLQIQKARYLWEIEEITGGFRIGDEVGDQVDRGQMNEETARLILVERIGAVEGGLPKDQKAKLDRLYTNVQEINRQEESVPSERASNYFLRVYRPALIGLSVGLLSVVVGFVWTIAFLMIGASSTRSSIRGKAALALVAFLGCACSGVVGYQYVKLSEGTPDWSGATLPTHIDDLRYQSVRLEFICGKFNPRGLW